MTRKVNIAGLSIYLNVAACAHSCRYCSTGRKKVHPLETRRITELVGRFGRWRDQDADPSFAIDIGMGHASNYDIELLVEIERLRKSVGKSGGGLRTIHLGGLRLKDEQELWHWLKARRDRAGVQEVHASLAGCGAVHDYWNHRSGDFNYLMLVMRTAASLGLRIRQRCFVTKSTLPCLDDLVAHLDRIPGATERYYNLFYYRGLAAGLEEERITEMQRDQLPAYIHDNDPASREWHSEREWIDLLGERCAPPRDIYLKLPVTSANVAELEAKPCGAIVGELIERTERAYSFIPPRRELIERYGDRDGQLVYKDAEDMENKWLDLHAKSSKLRFERHLTHLNIEL